MKRLLLSAIEKVVALIGRLRRPRKSGGVSRSPKDTYPLW